MELNYSEFDRTTLELIDKGLDSDNADFKALAERAETLLRENYELNFHLYFTSENPDHDELKKAVLAQNAELRSVFGIGEGA